MRLARPSCLIIANAPASLVTLCGISIIERLLRILQRLEFTQVTVLADSVVLEHLARASWARSELKLKLQECETRGSLSVAEVRNYLVDDHDRLLVLPGDFYYDARLLGALADADTTTRLVDSRPPPELEKLWENVPSQKGARRSGAVLIESRWLTEQNPGALLQDAAEASETTLLDAADAPAYLRDQRANVRPVFFPAPSPHQRRTAERILQQAAQKGTLDIPAMMHAPIETWLVSRLWRTRVRPNQLSAITMLFGLLVTTLYASGRLGAGVMLALAIGVLDGLDGKLARTKVETTKLGKWEHEADYFVETTWWLALAFHFAMTRTVPHIWLLWAGLFSCEFADRMMRGWIKKKLDRNLDDVTAFDRLVRLVGARRNIYTWILAIGMLVSAPAGAFVVICWWGIATSAIHIIRGLQIRQALPVA